MLISLSEIIGFVTFFLLLIYTLFIFIIGRHKQITNILLALFLLVNVLYLLGFLIRAVNDFFSINILWFELYGYSFGYLFGPTLYLYTKSLTDNEFKISGRVFIHSLPFVLQVLNLMSFRVFLNPLYFLLMHLHIVIYLYFSLELKKKFVKKISEYYSSIERINLRWLEIIIYAFAFMWIIDFTDLIINIILNVQSINSYAVFISVLINFVFANLLFIQSLKHPEILTGIGKVSEKVKYEYSTLDQAQKQEYLDKLEDICKNKKPYLSPNLTLDELSGITGIPSRHLSQIINESLNKNFYDFINHYRIEEAKRILAEKSVNKKTVLEIIYEVGFNSKSVFNTTFKKQTGLTPSEFRRRKAVV